jgi:iron complex transport system permease protein
MKRTFLFLVVLLIVAFVADVAIGSVWLSPADVWAALTGGGDEIVREIILNHRLPKALTAILTGCALATAGLLMQTLFHNPLAGPDVLGVTSGASLGVAVLTLGASVLPSWALSGWGQVSAAVLGSAAVLLLVIVVAIRIRQTVLLLILGMMFGYFASAIVSVLQSFSNPDTLKLFVTWTFGSLSAVDWSYMRLLALIVALGVAAAFLLQKQLNVFLLGSNYAAGLGVNVSRLRLLIIAITAVLAGISTAFTGPIAFIGITMPHIARALFRTADHRILLSASILCGAITLLLCDMASQLPSAQGTLPINAVTALVGVPVIVWVIVRAARR